MVSGMFVNAGPATAAFARRYATMLWVRGVLALILGVLLALFPSTVGTVLTLAAVLTIGVWLLLDGAALVLAAREARRHQAPGARWGVLAGLAAAIAGVLALVFPLTLAVYGGLVLVWFLALGLLVRGALALLDRIASAWARVLGVLDVVVGVLLLILVVARPSMALTTLLWVVAAYGILFGLLSCFTGAQLRRIARLDEQTAA